MAAGAAPTAEESTALAVFSRKIRFVEWKAFVLVDGKMRPFVPEGRALKDACRPIDGERWIYVLRQDPSGQTRLVDELHWVNGDVGATSMEETFRARTRLHRWPERDERPKPVSVGRFVSFAQRIFGKQQRHFFFASRIRLPAAALDALEAHGVEWMPPMVLEAGDPYTYGDDDPGALVPVLDPLTVALHLARYYSAALDELVEYTHAHEKMPRAQRDRVRKRSAKIMLADMVNTLLDVDPGVGRQLASGDGGSDGYGQLYDFRQRAAEQVGERRKAVERWATELVTWLRSPAIALLENAYRFDRAEERPKFFVVMAYCHSRLSASAPGRDLLDEQLVGEKRWGWIHGDLFGLSKDDAQMLGAKVGGAAAEWLKEYAPLGAVRQYKIEFFEHALNEIYGTKLHHHVEAVLHAAPEHWTLYEWQPKLGSYFSHRVDVEQLETVYSADEMRGMLELKPAWKSGITKGAFILDAINFAYRAKAVVAAFDDREGRAWAVVDMIGATAGIGKSSLEAFTEREVILGMERETLLRALGYLSAVADIVVAGIQGWEAWKDGDYGAVAGSALVAVGSVGVIVGMYTSVAWMGPVALVVVGGGVLVKALFGRNLDDYELFVRHCPWGEKFGENESDDPTAKRNTPTWSDTTYAEWANDYEAMFRALVRLLCKLEIAPVLMDTGLFDDEGTAVSAGWLESTQHQLRQAKMKMGWIPNGATLRLVYVEDWADAGDAVRVTTQLRFSERGAPLVPPSSEIDVQSAGDRALKIEGPGPREGAPPLLLFDQDFGDPQFKRVNPMLRKIVLAAELEVKLGDVQVNVPDSDHGAELYEKRW